MEGRIFPIARRTFVGLSIVVPLALTLAAAPETAFSQFRGDRGDRGGRNQRSRPPAAPAPAPAPAPGGAAVDPGVRDGPAGAGDHLPGLTEGEIAFFEAGLEEFAAAEGVGDGLGPRFNLDGCGGCHIQPAVGGSSPAVNPQVAIATAFGARNQVPSFVTRNGPIREARFKRNPDGTPDGGVHSLFVISGRVDDTGNARGCSAVQENFAAQVVANNVIFRIPTPLFGAGLIESIKDSTIVANVAADGARKAQLGISGRLNRNGNDGT